MKRSDAKVIVFPSQSDTIETPFLNREVSWLQFNERVLAQAADKAVPLLERVRFLSIFSSNLDEFFMKRVGGLKRQVDAAITSRSIDGLTPEQQLGLVRDRVKKLLHERDRLFRREIRPALDRARIHLLRWEQLTKEEVEAAECFFRSQMFAMLTPLSFDPGHPFPFISNLSSSLAVALQLPGNDATIFARVKTSLPVPQWIELNALTNADDRGAFRLISFTDLVRHNLPELFPGAKILQTMQFRVTRSAEIEQVEEEADDLLEMIAEEVRQRRFAKAVRLETTPRPDPWILSILEHNLGVEAEDIYEVEDELDYTSLDMIANLNVPALHYEPWFPITPPVFSLATDLFSIIRRHDLLVHHPFHSFTNTVSRFVAEAADDPAVRAIKITLYRVGEQEPLIPLLVRAADNGKQVLCVIELKARFDEARNIRWAQTLEDAGVHVVYGMLGYKTHAKTILVVREELGELRGYAHIGTGNYHAVTSRLYTDFGLFTCDAQSTQELAHFYNYLSGCSTKGDYQHLLVAPLNMRRSFAEHIRREFENAHEGRPAGIIAKMNSLQDKALIELLYEASRAGVAVELLVRGFCCLQPGLTGISENIRVRSIIGRLLEHSRVFYFRSGAADPIDGTFYIGSSDWMTRNLDYRVEVVVPVRDRTLRNELWDVLQLMLSDNSQAWELSADGLYRRSRVVGAPPIATHEQMMKMTATRYAENGVRP